MLTRNPDLIILHQNEFGYVGKCPCCDEIQFSFGNVLSHVPLKGFIALNKGLNKKYKSIQSEMYKMPDGKKTLIQTSASEVIVSLSKKELETLIELFDQAVLSLEVRQLLFQ